MTQYNKLLKYKKIKYDDIVQHHKKEYYSIIQYNKIIKQYKKV